MLLFFATSLTFTLTTIYGRFQSVESETNVIRESFEYVNDRVSKTSSRNSERITTLEKK